MDESLSIALLSVPFGPQRRDGIRNTVGKFAAELDSRGHNVMIIQQRGSNYPTYDRVDGVQVYRPYHFITFPKSPYNAKSPLLTYSLAVRKAQSEFDVTFDIIHVFGAAPLTGLRGILCRAFTDARIFYTAKAVPPNPNGFGPRSFRYSRVLNLTHGAFAATPTIKHHLEEYGCKVPIKVIPPNIDTQKFSPIDANDLRDNLDLGTKKLVFYYGHFVPSKGVDVLLQAIPKIIERDTSVRFILAWSRGGQREHIDDLIEDLGIHDYIDIIPWEQGFPINRYVNAADLVVLPYRSIVETEAVPLCVVESMAAGRPVLSTRQSHLEDYFNHGEDIYLVEPESPTQLADGVNHLLTSPDLREQLAENGQARSTEFAVDRIVDKHLEWYAHDNPRVALSN